MYVPYTNSCLVFGDRHVWAGPAGVRPAQYRGVLRDVQLHIDLDPELHVSMSSACSPSQVDIDGCSVRLRTVSGSEAEHGQRDLTIVAVKAAVFAVVRDVPSPYAVGEDCSERLAYELEPVPRGWEDEELDPQCCRIRICRVAAAPSAVQS